MRIPHSVTHSVENAFYDYKLILKMKNSMKIQEIDLNECPDCKKPVQKPYFIEGCGHLLCKDCAYRLASKWDPCPGTALNFNYSI